MIERRPKILRLGDKSEPFLFAVNRWSRDYRKPATFSQSRTAVSATRSGSSLLNGRRSRVATRRLAGSADLGGRQLCPDYERVARNPRTILQGDLGCVSCAATRFRVNA